jgi:hypothetical protein
MALIGYARVSTNEQHLHLQQDAFSAAGCLKIYTDTISGVKSERKGLDGGEIDVVGRRDVLDAGREDDRVTHEGPLLMEHVAKGEDNAHSEAIVPLFGWASRSSSCILIAASAAAVTLGKTSQNPSPSGLTIRPSWAAARRDTKPRCSLSSASSSASGRARNRAVNS